MSTKQTEQATGTVRAVVYARISADDRRYASSSIQGQLEDCRRYADEKGYQVVGEFYEEPDRFTSGRDWLPELTNVLRLAAGGGFDVLVVKDTDRLARNLAKAIAIEVDLEHHGVVVEYVRGQYEHNAEGSLLKNVKRAFDQYEADKIRQRMVDGMRRSVRGGNIKVSNQPPYGYSVVTTGKARTFQVNESEAAVVRLIFDMYVNQAATIYSIAKYLNDHGVPKPASRSRGWSHGTLENILTNETYTGRWYYGKSTMVAVPGTNKKRKVAQPRDQWILVEVPSIIDDQLFQAAQRRRQSNKRRGKARTNFYVLGGMLRCAECGASMTGVTRKDRGGKQYYVCVRRFGHDRHPATTRCTGPYHFAAEVNEAVWSWIQAILLNPPRLRAELAKYQESIEAETTPLTGLLESNQAKLRQLQAEKDRLIKAYLAEALSLDEMADQKTQLDQSIAEVSQAVEALTAELEQQQGSRIDATSIEELVAARTKDLRSADASPQAQREIYQRLDMTVTLGETDGNRWADIRCALGRLNVLTRFTEIDYDESCLTISARVAVTGAVEEAQNFNIGHKML